MEDLKEVFSEVVDIINNSEEDIIEKIPKGFMNFLNENKSEDYIVNIDYSKDDWENDLRDDTKALIALIYRDYIVSPEKRKELINDELNFNKQIEEELREKYNPDNIFKTEENNKITTEEVVVKNSLITKEENFLTKIINRIKSFFK